MINTIKRLTVIVTALAAGAFILVNVAWGEESPAEAEIQPPDADGNGIPETIEADLAERFCPHVIMHEKQKLQKPKYEYLRHYVFPQDVHIMLDTGCYGRYRKALFAPDYAVNDNVEEAISFGECKPRDFITFGGMKGHGEKIDRHLFWPNYYILLVNERNLYAEPYVYYNIFKDDSERPVIQYWFFYPYNCWANDHEGDWEHINVRITSADPASADIDEVVYYFHKWYKTIPAGSEELEITEGTHPVVYVGGQPHEWVADNFEASGASYWTPGVFPRVGAGESVTEVVVAGDDSKICRPEEFTKVWIGKTEANPEAWWLDFPGKWGRPGKYFMSTLPESPFGEEAPCGPWHHECWEKYLTPGYHEYKDVAKAAYQKP